MNRAASSTHGQVQHAGKMGEGGDMAHHATVAMEEPMDSTGVETQPGDGAVSSGAPLAREWDDAMGRFFSTDPVTGESTWEEPTDFQPSNGDDMREAEAVVLADECVDVEGDAVAGVWMAQYDPTAARVYYYHTSTGACQWELPDGFVDTNHQDDKMDGAVRIQSAFRSRKARDRVKQLSGGSRPESAASSTGSSVQRRWRQHFDPRSQQYYYHNIDTGDVTWEKPMGDDDLLSETDSQGDSATRIQCAIRKRAASKCVDEKKQLARDLTSDVIIDQKLRDIVHAVDEIDREVKARAATLDSLADSPRQLRECVQSWSASASRIRDAVLGHHQHAVLVKQLEATGGQRLTTAQEFHDAMATTRSECLALLKSVLLTDAEYLELDVLSVNEAFRRYVACSRDTIFRIPEAKVRAAIHADELDLTLARAEKCLRKAMGLTDFTAGATTSRTKSYGEWREPVSAAVESVRQLERTMQHKRDLLALYEQGLIERRESESMAREDQLSHACEEKERSAGQERITHARFLELCRGRWQSGLDKRIQDEVIVREAAEAREAKQEKERRRSDKAKEDYDHARTRVKLSIWEAVREGYTVDTVRGMIYAEMQKTRQNGFDFDLRTARSNRGETLVQIACWAGHTELVSFLLDEGANLRTVDSLVNGFTLLHDTARRGDSLTTRLLVSRGLEQDVVDRSGDTPLHWAVRNNHYETVHTLLGAYMHRHDPDYNDRALRAVRARNNRGRKPIELAKSECIRRLLQAFDEGRICSPQFRNRSNSRASLSPQHGRRMSDYNAGQTANRNASAAATGGGDSKTCSVLTKALTTSSLPQTSRAAEPHHHTHEEDEFGLINVVASR